MSRRWSTLALAVLAALALPALVLAGPAGGPAAGPDTIVIGTQQEPAVIGLTICDACTMFVATMVSAPMFVPDVELTNEWKYQPVAMEKMPSLRDGDWRLLPGDKMQVTWRLRRGLRWQDGTPLTAADYIFGWRVNLNPRFPSAGRDVSERVENIQAPNANTLIVQWKRKYAFANLGVAGSVALPRHILNAAYQRDPSKLPENAWGTSERTVGNGPYRITQWQKGSSITLERWDQFNHNAVGGSYRTPSAIRRIVFRFVPDTNTQIANVLAGSIDAFDETAIPFVQGLELENRLRREGRRDWIVEAVPGLIWEHIDLNLDNFHLRDKRVRHALIYGMNREAIVQSLFEGKQPVSHSLFPEKHYGYHRNIKRYPFDQARARALLQEAGYRPGPDGILVKDGQRLSLEFATTAGNRTREAVQQIIQQQLRQIGIEIVIRNQPARVYFGESLPKRQFTLAMYAWVFGPTSDCEGLYTGDTLPPDGQNYPGYKNDEVTRLCHAIPEELDEGRRAQMLRRFQEIWIEDLPVIPLYFRSDYAGRKASLQNWRPTGATAPVTWNATQWRWAR
ncbi:MAG: peptide ABC transporter substrate-binding protein [Armatimonadota bacterium]|nr:peptide ABC transporter substrate-binding protein [Armatimonadota bacterium]MDR5696898.1 peptide ABC transporter substrate-binding protein [Armatimonadota bacterium]